MFILPLSPVDALLAVLNPSDQSHRRNGQLHREKPNFAFMFTGRHSFVERFDEWEKMYFFAAIGVELQRDAILSNASLCSLAS